MELDLIEYDLDKDTKVALEQAIGNFMLKSQAKLVVLTDDGGRILAYQANPKTEDYQTEFAASIMSGMFLAAMEMSKMLKMEEPDLLQFEGKSMDVIVKYIKPRFLLGILVGKSVSIGTVRLFLRELAQNLESVLANIKKVPVKTVKIDAATLEEKLSKIIGGML